MTTPWQKAKEAAAKLLFRKFHAGGGYGPETWEENPDTIKAAWLEQVAAVLSTLKANGYVVVPKEPTEAMKRAGDETDIGLWHAEGQGISYFGGLDDLGNIYTAMITAAQQEME
jgi:hypothetical protein